MRAIAPIVVISTVVVFASGVALLYAPSARSTLLPLHKVSFIVWLAFTALHVLGHLAELPAALRAGGRSDRAWDDLGAGRGGRALSLAAALVGGLLLALAVESRFGVWTHLHHHVH